ncbi:MAG: hypothetical protein FWF84_02485 [Kiritimatiellaeota bacterium]|nr:hypothetical protein [Kiritimatiellota bacterium]
MSAGLTEKQAKAFWRAFAQACSELRLSGKAETEAYRKRVLMEECGVGHMADISRTTGFEKLMIRLLSDANDHEAASRYTIGEDRRMAKMVEVCASHVMQCLGTSGTGTVEYIAGIIRQAGHNVHAVGEDYWLDIPDTLLYSVFQMLDTHRRRLLKAASFHGSLTFTMNAAYHRSPLGAIIVSASAPKPSVFKVHALK